ncbi:hypothetical protein EV586_102334 [Tumebacillus sp. BK434]|nr:hypothetical protein EV586_102334 [Tumebacillus sp. BK434]
MTIEIKAVNFEEAIQNNNEVVCGVQNGCCCGGGSEAPLK